MQKGGEWLVVYFPRKEAKNVLSVCVVVVGHGWSRIVAAGVSSVCSNGSLRFQIRNIDWLL